MSSVAGNRDSFTADMVVIGGGGAGMAAALTALEKGASVAVLEKRLAIGGNASLAGGFLFAAESRLQKEAKMNVSRDAVFRETLDFHHYDRVNPRILRAFIDRSADTIDWLQNKGVEFTLLETGNHLLKGISQPMGGFGRVMKLLAGKFKDGGGQILLRTAARRIQCTANGKVSGVLATNREGKELKISARSVVLATGGFTGNKELLNRYFPHYYDSGVYRTDALPLMGDGLMLAVEAGAGMDDYATLIRECVFSFEPGKNMPNRAAMEPRTIWVNRRGERFLDASISHANENTNALLCQPGKIAFALFDDGLVQKVMATPDPFAPPGTAGANARLRQVLLEEAGKGVWAAFSDTWEGIALWIGTNPAVLKATVDEYNSFCDRGHDGLFAKNKKYLLPLRRPPFYALKFCPLMIDTAGPVRVNERMEVLDGQDVPIPGFYAAGVITGGWQGYDYHLFGSALGYSLTSGRIAGENASQIYPVMRPAP